MVPWGRGPTEEQQEATLAELQDRIQDLEVPGRYPGTKADAADLRRFLVARDFDLAKTEAMVRQHAEWRAKTFPIARDSTIDMLVATKRVGEILCWNSLNEPVVLFDCSWGNLLNGATTEQFFSAYMVFIDEVLLEMQARGSVRWNWLSIGGPPPMDLARQLASVFEANYPELLRVAVIAPIPSGIKRVINSMLWFLPEKTKSKFAIASTSDEACGILECQVEALPEHLRDLQTYERTRKADGVTMEVPTEDGHRQVVRSLEVGAGKTVSVPLELSEGVESVAFSLNVQQPLLMPRLIVGEHDIRFRVRLKVAGADDSGEDEVLLPETLVTVSSPCEQDWANEAKRSGSLHFELDNSHSWISHKCLDLTQLIRMRKGAS